MKSFIAIAILATSLAVNACMTAYVKIDAGTATFILHDTTTTSDNEVCNSSADVALESMGLDPKPQLTMYRHDQCRDGYEMAINYDWSTGRARHIMNANSTQATIYSGDLTIEAGKVKGWFDEGCYGEKDNSNVQFLKSNCFYEACFTDNFGDCAAVGGDSKCQLS